jgi:hypothetical protein
MRPDISYIKGSFVKVYQYHLFSDSADSGCLLTKACTMVKLNIIIKLIIISLKEKYFQNRNIMNDAFGIIIKTYDTKSQYLYLKNRHLKNVILLVTILLPL